GVLLVIAGGSLAFWARRPGMRSGWLLVAVLIADLAWTGAAFHQADRSPARDALRLPEELGAYGARLNAAGERLLPRRGALEPTGAAAPNVSRFWGLPSASGYGPLLLRRYSELLGMNTGGAVADGMLAPGN